MSHLKGSDPILSTDRGEAGRVVLDLPGRRDAEPGNWIADYLGARERMFDCEWSGIPASF